MKFGNSIFKTFFLCLCIIANVNFAYAQSTTTASILPLAKTTFLDQNGKPLSGGKVYFYTPLTTTFKTTWQDSAKTVPNTNPVILDSAGRALIWGDGVYRQLVKDKNNNLIWDQTTSSFGSGSSGGSTVGDGMPVGTIHPSSSVTAPTNYQFAYGQALSRSFYSSLFGAITVSASIGCSGGSPIISVADTSYISVGTILESICAAGSPAVISKTSNTVTLNLNSTITVATTGRFLPYGNGDASTTFNVPDLRGQVIAGRNNMGGVASANLAAGYFGTDPNGLGAKGGSQSHIPSLFDMPPHRHAVFVQDPGHTHTVTAKGAIVVQGAGVNITVAQSGTSDGTVQATLSTTGILPYDAPSGGVANQTALTGIGNAYSLVQPTQSLNYIIKVLPDTNIGTAACGNLLDAGTACTANTGTSGHTLPYLDANNTFSGNNFFPNGITVTTASASLLGNPGSSAGPSGNFTIQSLVSRGVPDTNNDKLLIYDAAAGFIKYVTPGQIASGGTAGVSALNGLTGSLQFYEPPQGRLTLTSFTPVMTSSVASTTVVYYTPYAGNLVPIYNGTNFVPTAFAEVSQATTDTTKSPAAVVANSCYDMFAWVDGVTNRVTRGVAWTTVNNSSSSILVRVNGIYLNNASIANGPAAARGTYVGTICSNATATIDYFFGGAGFGGSPAFFGVWNMYNRVEVGTTITNQDVSWTNSASAGAWKATDTGNVYVKTVRGFDEDAMTASHTCIGQPATGGASICGVGVNSTSAPNGTTGYIAPTLTTPTTTTGTFTGVSGIGASGRSGLITVTALEANTSANAATFYGVIGGFGLSGLNFRSSF